MANSGDELWCLVYSLQNFNKISVLKTKITVFQGKAPPPAIFSKICIYNKITEQIYSLSILAITSSMKMKRLLLRNSNLQPEWA
jgi:hypothetical protein